MKKSKKTKRKEPEALPRLVVRALAPCHCCGFKPIYDDNGFLVCMGCRLTVKINITYKRKTYDKYCNAVIKSWNDAMQTLEDAVRARSNRCHSEGERVFNLPEYDYTGIPDVDYIISDMEIAKYENCLDSLSRRRLGYIQPITYKDLEDNNN